MYSSRMHTTRSLTIHVVAATRCQYPPPLVYVWGVPTSLDIPWGIPTL